MRSLQEADLDAFVEKYAEKEARIKAVEALRKICDDENGISPLFARLALKQFEINESMPGDYMEFVVDYIYAMRKERIGILIPDDFMKAVQVTAYGSILEELKPI